MSTKIAVTKEGFERTGRSSTNDRVVGEMDRMIPLATADILVLEKYGFERKLLDDQVALRDKLAAELAACRHLRGEKQGARLQEIEAIKEGRHVLRCAAALAMSAAAQQPVPDASDAQSTQEIVAGLNEQIDALSGRIGQVSSRIRNLLETSKSILSRPEFGPPKGAKASRTEFMTRLDAVLEKLRLVAESKKTFKDGSKDKTATISELRGRAISGLRLLSRVGQAAFRDRDDAGHSRLYELKALYRRSSGRNNGQPTAPASPTPAENGPQPLPTVPKPVTPTPP